MKYSFLMIFVVSLMLRAQHIVPFASHNNSIELSVKNSSASNAEQVVVEVSDAPQWVQFNTSREIIQNIVSNGITTARFSFSVDRSAPVGTNERVRFSVRSSSGELWIKEIEIRVAPPHTFEVFQNYPNPFNPSTTISYQLPTSNHTTVTIFDLLGKEVAMLYNGDEGAGFHQHLWNASNVATGVYICQIGSTNQQGEQIFVRKKMILAK